MDKPAQKRFAPIPIEAEVIGKKTLDAAYAVHAALGPGLLESVYEACLAHKLREQRVLVETQVIMPVTFEGIQIETGLRLGYLINFNVVHLKDGIKRMVN